MKADKLTGYILQHPDGRFLTAINQNKQRYALTWDSPRFYKDKDRAEFAVKKHFREVSRPYCQKSDYQYTLNCSKKRKQYIATRRPIMKQKVLLMLLALIAIFVFGCGKKASHEAVNNPADDVTCAITDNEAVCDDGNVYIVPEDVDIAPSIDSDVDVDIIIIVTVPASEDDPEAICEKDNRNGRKCRKRKKKHGGKK